MEPTITCSIVIYNTDTNILASAINSFLGSTANGKLFLVDNSPIKRSDLFLKNESIEYIFNGANLGYGKAHNIAIRRAIALNSKYHLILNPDITFSADVIDEIYKYIEVHDDVGLIMPKVLYTNGEIQRLCKLLPSPVDLIGRRFLGGRFGKKRNAIYELHNFNYDRVINTPCLSGCFMFVRMTAFKTCGTFDERFFMYLEDYDLTRRIHQKYKTIFFPDVEIFHGYQKQSYKSVKLLLIHIGSAVKYFTKWGWIFDKERKKLNNYVLDQINHQ